MANRATTFNKNVSCIADLKRLGSERLPQVYRDFCNEGAMDLITLCDNEAAFGLYKIRPRILVNIENIDTTAEIFGTRVSCPLGFSPAAMQKLAHPDGELATSRAAVKFGLCMGMSSYSTTSLEDVAEQGSGNPYAIQMCMLKDRSITLQLLRRAEIYTAEDVQLAIQHGVDGVIISNHGGRQLDGVPATLDLLRECAPVAKGKIPIAVDGGIRRGSDIFKALALGASHCFVGRIPIWGLAYNGQEGVELAVKILLQELRITMALAGCRSISERNSSYLSILEPDGVLAKL